MRARQHFESLGGRAAFGHGFEVRLGFEQPLQTFAEQNVVVKQ
jgi:hypothetical protein